MSSGMNTEQAKEYAKTMTYSEAVSNVKYGKYIKYRKATMIKLRELAEIADRLDRKTEPSNSEKPNNCEHITEDGVTCAKYPACDDCLDNPLNKVKGSERLLKGYLVKSPQKSRDSHEIAKTEPFFRNPTKEEMESVNKYIDSISPTGVNVFDLMDEPQTERKDDE